VSRKSEALQTFLEEAGIHLHQRQGWQKVSCFNKDGHPHGDRNPSASVNLGTGRYNCFACGLGGDVYDLMQELYGWSYMQAKDKLGTDMPEIEEPTWI